MTENNHSGPDKTTAETARDQRADALSAVAGVFSARGIAEVFFRYKHIMVIPMIMVPLFSVLFSFMVPERYMSTTTILVDRSGILNPLVRFETAVSIQNWDEIATLRKIIYSRPVIEKIIDELDLAPPGIEPREYEWLIDDVRGNIHILSQESDSFEIGCSAADPGTAQQMAEKVSRLFIGRTLEGSRKEANAAVCFIQNQLKDYTAQLETAKEDLEDFRLANIDKIEQGNAIRSRLDRYKREILKTQRELRTAEYKRDLLRNRLSNEEPMVIAERLYNEDTPYQRRYRELRLERAKLLSSRSPEHPEAKKLAREMDAIRELLREEKEQGDAEQTREIQSPVYQKTKANLQETEIEISVLEHDLETYREHIDKLEAQLAALPGLQNRYEQLQSEVQNLTETQNSLNTKLQQAKISRAVELEQQKNRFKIINPPLVPYMRYTPIRKKFAVAGILTGIALGFVIVIGLEIIEPRLSHVDEAVRITGLPLWASIPAFTCQRKTRLWQRLPLVRTVRKGVSRFIGHSEVSLPEQVCQDLKRGTLTMHKDRSQAPFTAEHDENIAHIMRCMCSVSTELYNLSLTSSGGLVVAVTGTRPKEGCTMITGNMGAALTEEFSQPVLLIDGDISDSDLSKAYGREHEPGLQSVLNGDRDVADCVYHTDISFLDILPAGKIVDGGGYLQGSHRLQELISTVKEDYAFVLFDLPPVTVFPQTRHICRLTDVNLLVTYLYRTPRGVAKSIASTLPPGPYRGLVVNGREFWLPSWLLRWL
mgnify:CR=1 FL=1